MVRSLAHRLGSFPRPQSPHIAKLQAKLITLVFKPFFFGGGTCGTDYMTTVEFSWSTVVTWPQVLCSISMMVSYHDPLPPFSWSQASFPMSNLFKEVVPNRQAHLQGRILMFSTFVRE